MNRINKLMHLGGRCSGRTQALIDGWKPGTTIIAANEQHAKQLRQRLPKNAPPGAVISIDKLQPYGLEAPIIVDHYSYEVEIGRLVNELTKQSEKKKREGCFKAYFEGYIQGCAKEEGDLNINIEQFEHWYKRFEKELYE